MLGLALAGHAAPAPAEASSAGRYLTSDSYQELVFTIQATTDQQRLADLQTLEQALSSSSDRAQVTNRSSHNVGVFARYKKLPESEPAGFYVLGPGHRTDDDFELLGVYVPADVSLAWSGGGVQAGSGSRVARLLEGQQLQIGDPVLEASPAEVSSLTTASATTAPATEAPQARPAEAVSYALSLPVFSVTARANGIPELPALSQEQLDLEPETAPLD